MLKLYHGTESTRELHKMMSAGTHPHSFQLSTSKAVKRVDGQYERFYMSNKSPNDAYVAGAETTLEN